MNASKSASLLMKAHSFEERGIPFLCLKPSVDNRDGVDIISSRIGIHRECIAIEQNDNILDYVQKLIYEYQLNAIPSPKWILVDESQFLTKLQVEQLAEIVDGLDINVICYGLRTDFTTHLFEGAKRLMELADTIEEIKISCKCGRKALVNARIDADGQIVVDGQQILIGGNDRYISLCRKCYKEQIKKRFNNR